MNRTSTTLIELLLAAIFLIMIIPLVNDWSQSAGGYTKTVRENERQTRDQNLR